MPTEWSEEQRERQALSSANAVIKEHIGLLHRYNEIKDIGQGLMGMLADQRGVR
ncbi:swi5-like zinc finger protein, partial [Friedmanniomyces endolithicus]